MELFINGVANLAPHFPAIRTTSDFVEYYEEAPRAETFVDDDQDDRTTDLDRRVQPDHAENSFDPTRRVCPLRRVHAEILIPRRSFGHQQELEGMVDYRLMPKFSRILRHWLIRASGWDSGPSGTLFSGRRSGRTSRREQLFERARTMYRQRRISRACRAERIVRPPGRLANYFTQFRTQRVTEHKFITYAIDGVPISRTAAVPRGTAAFGVYASHFAMYFKLKIKFLISQSWYGSRRISLDATAISVKIEAAPIHFRPRAFGRVSFL